MFKNLICLCKKLSFTYLDLILFGAFILCLVQSFYDGITGEEIILNIIIDLILVVGTRTIILCCVQQINTAIKKFTS